MPKHARSKSKRGIYHVMLRGINRQAIFLDDEDCEKHLQSLGEYQDKCDFALPAYCRMGNHVHLLLQMRPRPFVSCGRATSVPRGLKKAPPAPFLRATARRPVRVHSAVNQRRSTS